MGKVGVTAVVEGLELFIGKMGKIDKAIRRLVSPTNILGSTFSALGNILEGVGSFVANTLAHAFGELLADAVQFVVMQIKELVSATIEAGQEFQTLSLRLNTLNFNDLTEQEKSYSNAQDIAIEKTQEQLSWLQKLAAQTPFDNTDISNVYTLARGYSFADKDARGLVDTIVDFTSGMGLGNTEMTRIIKNLGQMQQLGKVTQRELNDLAVGAFVPVNKVLEMMQEETGLTGQAFQDFRNSGDGVQSFLRNFTALVEGDFGGSAQKMARTFGAATDNMKDFIKSLFGLNVVKPVLDVLGGRVADFMDELTSDERWNQIVGLADRIGKAVSGIVEDILGLAPDAKGVADKIVDAFDGIADWLEDHRDDIVGFAQDAAKWFREDLLPAIQQVWDFLFGKEGEPGAIEKFGAWLKDDFMPFVQREVLPGLKDMFDLLTGKKKQPETGGSPDERDERKDPTALQNVVSAVASIGSALPSILELLGAIGEAIISTFGGDETQTFSEFITNDLIPAIKDLTKWVEENQAIIGEFVRLLLIVEIFGMFIGAILSAIAALTGLVAGLTTFFAVLGGIKIIMTYIQLLMLFRQNLLAIINYLISQLTNFKNNVVNTVRDVVSAIRDNDWAGAGRAIVDGIKRGVQNSWGAFIGLIKQLARNALNTFYSIFNIHSPSQEMYDIGEMIVKGLAKGVSDSAGMAIKAMSKTAANMLSAASPQMAYTLATAAPSQTTYQNTNNFNATFNSNTRNEPLMQDFSMMASLVGQ